MRAGRLGGGAAGQHEEMEAEDDEEYKQLAEQYKDEGNEAFKAGR
jgi:hypothetical protein